MTESCTKVAEAVKGAGLEELSRTSGVVLAGGVAQLPGIADFARELLGLNVRVADMQLSIDGQANWGGMTNVFQDPQYAVAVGIVSMASRGELSLSYDPRLPAKESKRGLWDWFKSNFE